MVLSQDQKLDTFAARMRLDSGVEPLTILEHAQFHLMDGFNDPTDPAARDAIAILEHALNAVFAEAVK